jgi:hypothetical protein
VWISGEPVLADLEAGGGQEEATQISREHALVRGPVELIQYLPAPQRHPWA